MVISRIKRGARQLGWRKAATFLRVDRTPKAKKAQHGFSLMEVLIALLILSLVVSVTGPRFIGYLSRAKVQTADVQIENIEAAADLFLLDTGRYPSEAEGLEILVRNTTNVPGWSGPYLKDGEIPLDPWGAPYQVKRAPSGLGIEVYTLGPDANSATLTGGQAR
jgi:general secretion pathway protein G